MTKYSTSLNEYVSKEKSFIKSEQEFFDHIDTIKLNYFEGTVNKPTTELKHGKTIKVKHISNVFVTLELLEKGMLRNMRWLESKNQGCGYEVLKDGYVVSLEYENEEESIGCTKYFIYEDAEAAFEMFNKIRAMYK
jgi:Aminopeptidase C